MSHSHFSPALFRFLRDIAVHNDRDWFQENKDRYLRDVKEPGLQFIIDFAPVMQRISPHFLCDPRPHGGSLYRIYRDIRFSKDKRPYKTHAGIYFAHAPGKGHGLPGFYLHFEPRSCFVGMGLWHPDNATLKQVRTHVADHPDRWLEAVKSPDFQRHFTVTGRTLLRHPRDFDPTHPLIDVLKLKDFTAVAPLTQKQVTGDGFLEEFAGLCDTGGRLVRFLCEGLGQPY